MSSRVLRSSTAVLVLVVDLVLHDDHVERPDPADDEHQLLQMTFSDNRFLDDFGVFDGGLELGERAIEQTQLVEGVLE